MRRAASGHSASASGRRNTATLPNGVGEPPSVSIRPNSSSSATRSPRARASSENAVGFALDEVVQQVVAARRAGSVAGLELLVGFHPTSLSEPTDSVESMPAFVPGIELAHDYWFDVVAPILDPYLPRAERAAALLAEGSDVLGFDTEQSTDHGWGPKVFVFADGLDRPARRELIDAVDRAIPDTFRGYPTRYPRRDDAPIRHQVLFTSVAEEFDRRLGCDPRAPMHAIDWLRIPTQHLRALTAGAVFEDGPGAVTAARHNLTWYPDAVWLYVLGCQWQRIAQEEAFAGRCAQVGDDAGSAVVTARLVRDVMRLGFLIEREYAPYSKWLGTAFARLRCGPDVGPAHAGRAPRRRTGRRVNAR